jgi:cytochrome c553
MIAKARGFGAVRRAAVALAVALGGLIAQPGAAAAGNQGRELAAACASCHRPDGRGTAIPAIAGLDEGRIVQSMLAYRAAAGGNQIMHVVAGALSPEEIAAVAHYIAVQPSAAARR